MRKVPSRDGAARQTVLMSRAILQANGPSQVVDHINGNKLDNRRSNLRIVTPAENAQNRRLNRDNKSGYRGVSWHKGRESWQAHAKLAGHQHYLGLFDDPREAARVAAAFRAQHMPFSAEIGAT